MAQVERNLKDSLVPIRCQGQGCHLLDQAAQNSTQPGLELFQDWGSHSFSGQSLPVPYHPLTSTLSSRIKPVVDKTHYNCPENDLEDLRKVT